MARTKFRTDEVVVAVESFVTADDRVIHRGDRLRGDDPLVRHAPHLFIHDGATAEEVGQARAGMMGFLDEPPPADPTAPKVLGPLTIDNPHALVATADASFDLEDRSRVVVREGDLVDDRAPWVIKARQLQRGLFRRPRKAEVSA